MSLPGFVDLQVNGCLGVDFSAPDLSPEGVASAVEAVRASGTSDFLPTVITAPLSVYERNLPRLADACEAHDLLGLHLEGPFLCPEPGARGAHDPRHVLAPDPRLLDRLQGLARGWIRLVTVAAGVPGVEPLIRAARELGVAVSLGHQLATADDLARARDAGATALTHLGNGLPNLLPRHPNPLWAGLATDGLTAMLIADGHHLPPEVLRVALRAKGLDQVIVTSDAAPLAGLPPGRYRTLGNDVELEPSGRIHNPEERCLVGSAALLCDGMSHLASLEPLTVDELMRLGRHNALRLLGVERPAPPRLSFDPAERRFHPLRATAPASTG